MFGTILDIGIIILSCLVLLYILVYSLTLQKIKSSFQDKKVQKDSNISLMFYVGIGILGVNELLEAISNLYGLSLNDIYHTLKLVSLAIFVLALSLRLKTARERFDVYNTKAQAKGELAKHLK